MKGRFYDGITSNAHSVTIHPSSSFITITAEKRAFEFQWLYRDMLIVAPWRVAVPGKIGNIKSPDARLAIEDEKTWQAITKRLKKSQSIDRIPATWRNIAGLAAVTICALLLIFLLLPKILIDASAMLPQSWMDTLGKNALVIMVEDPVCTAANGKGAVDRITDRLRPAAGTEQSFTVYVVQNDDISNALTFPGGHIVLFSGLLKEAGSPEEVAGVLAHEMGHAVHGHARKSLMRGAGMSIAASLMFGNDRVGNIVARLSELGFSREEEREADRFAAQALIAARINPAGLSIFFERHIDEADSDTAKLLAFFSTHPASNERIAQIKALYRKEESYTAPLSPAAWKDLQDNICSETRPLADVLK